MSDFLVHLVETQAELEEILDSGFIPEFGTPLGALYDHSAAKQKKVFPNQHSCCLSEIPLDLLDRLAERHGHFGIVIGRDFAKANKAVRVWYLDAGSEIGSHFFDWASDASYQSWADIDEKHHLWKITPFIDQVTDGSLTKKRREFDWEREWRVVGGLRISMSEVHLIFAPKLHHDELGGLETPLADLTWVQKDLQGVFAGLPTFDPNT